MKIKLLVLLLLSSSIHYISTAQVINGSVSLNTTKNGKQQKESLPNATIHWAGTQVATVSDVDGKFSIKTSEKTHLLVASFVGCLNDTIDVQSNTNVELVLSDNASLEEIVVKDNAGTSYVSKLNTQLTTQISTAGLHKMACCNLSESFQNNASIDVGYSDAITGAKQIQMLGLAGVYTQILTENIPTFRGLASSFGLSYIPGSWMQSIQVSKGTSSVINGYESVTGQINVELKKPQNSDPFFLNLFASNEGRFEGNFNAKIPLGKKLSTMILAHTSVQKLKMDMNHDDFLDVPMSEQYNFSNRYIYESDRHHSILYFNFLDELREGGQLKYYDKENSDGNNTESYGIRVKTRRYHVFSKNGFAFKKEGNSIGWQNTFTYHEQNSQYGKTNYNAKQNIFYSNLIFESNLNSEYHKISTGLSFLYDKLDENFKEQLFAREEVVPGAFMEYSFNMHDEFNILLGIRSDYHSIHGLMITPRFHLKYVIAEHNALRLSAGKAYRTANILAENSGLMASSRKMNLATDLEQEQAWNYGINFTHEWELSNKRKANFTIDFYRTDFVNQVVTDLDANPQQANFYNLSGKSYSNSFQAELMLQPIKGMEITAAWRYNDAKTTTNGQLNERVFTPKYKAILSISYATKFDKWKIDITNQFIGKTRLPDTYNNPEEFRRDNYSKEYYLLYAQITRKFKRFDAYIGAENLTGYHQENPIIDPQNPFNQYFDASMIWAPLSKQMFYAGIRLSIK